MEIKGGTGKLYKLSDDQFIGYVNYRLFHHPAATNWWGELTLVDYIRLDEDDLFVIELEDKRKSQCHLKKRVNMAANGYPARFVYHVTGTSPVE